MARRRAIDQHLHAGEFLVESAMVAGSADIAVDLPQNQVLDAHVTNHRLIFLEQDRGAADRAPLWSVNLVDIGHVESMVRKQNRIFNASRETIFTLHLSSGRRVVCGHMHVVDGPRRIKRLVEALQAAVRPSGIDQGAW